MPKDSNEVEIERQKQSMRMKGATENQVNDPNARASFNQTGQVDNTTKGTGCAGMIALCLTIAGALAAAIMV